MSVPANTLTKQQALFVTYLGKGLDKAEAAERAGYSEATDAYHVLGNATVARLIDRTIRTQLREVAAPLALKVLTDLTRDTAVHPAIRRSAARDLLDRAGYVPPKAADADVNDKSIAAMPAEELAALVNKLEGELASRAKDVSAPNAQGMDDELLDMLG